jgi:hypothetical protein
MDCFASLAMTVVILREDEPVLLAMARLTRRR